jgi:hypothetical protein
MRTTKRSILCAAIFGAASFTIAAPVDLPEYGFSIDLLDAVPASGATTALMTFLPVTDGFAPNINVNIQTFTGTLADYAALSKKQFADMQWTVIDEKLTGDTEWRAEYKGPMQGNDMHFYARAIPKNGKVYLVTASAKESQWSAVAEKLRTHADSFKAK